MQHWKSESKQVRGINLHFYRTGGNFPPLVLVHGITDDGLCWTPVAEALASHYDVIMVDARGHGKSDAPADGYTLESIGHDLAALIQALELSKPIVLGHSMGAITTLVMAALYPDLPKAILLEDPPPFWMPPGDPATDAQFRAGFNAWIGGLKRKTHDDLLAEVRQNSPAWSEAEFEPWVNSKHRFSPNVAALVHPDDLTSIDLPVLFKQIACPAYLLQADSQLGAATSEADIAVLKQSIPALQVIPFAGAGHNIRRDRFADYMAAVDRILQELR